MRTEKVSHAQVKKPEESPLCEEIEMFESAKFIGPSTLEEFAKAKSLEVECLQKELAEAREREFISSSGGESQKAQMTFTFTFGFQSGNI